MAEAKLAQDIRNGIAKEEMQWLEIKREKELLLDVNELKDLFESVFQIIRSSLVAIARKHPIVMNEVDNMLESLYSLGTKVAIKANKDADNFVQEMLEKELTLQEATEEAEEKLEVEDARY